MRRKRQQKDENMDLLLHFRRPKLRSSKRQKSQQENLIKMKKVLKEVQHLEEEEEEPVAVPREISTEGLSAAEILRMPWLIQGFGAGKATDFLQHCRSFMTSQNIENAEVLTVDQADTPLWHQLRIGRITASRIHQASRCKTKSGSLFDSIMGRSRGWSFAMQRGTNLEDQVFKVVQKEMRVQGVEVKQVGLILDARLPHFGASPDGLADDFTLEIKCPFTVKTHAEYTDVTRLKKQYFGQIQLQMHIAQRKKALLAVADLNFERNKRITKVWIDYDEEYVTDLIESAENFWMEAIFPGLLREYRRKLKG